MRTLFVLSLVLSLVACATAPTTHAPPVVEAGGEAGESPAAPAPTVQAPSAGGRAVVALLERAERADRGGDPDAAAAALERALRIEPHNARLWNRLAQTRLRQGLPAQAEQMALKSNALAHGDHRLQASNWRLVARARWARNDADGAAAAERRAGDLERRD